MRQIESTDSHPKRRAWELGCGFVKSEKAALREELNLEQPWSYKVGADIPE